jgi:hypothetical protein
MPQDTIGDTRRDCDRWRRTRRRCADCPYGLRKRIKSRDGIGLDIPTFLRSARGGPMPGDPEPPDRCCGD